MKVGSEQTIDNELLLVSSTAVPRRLSTGKRYVQTRNPLLDVWTNVFWVCFCSQLYTEAYTSTYFQLYEYRLYASCPMELVALINFIHISTK